MADISILSRLVSGVQRNVDLSANTLVVGSIKIGTSSPTELTKTILDRLVNLQNGSDVDATFHTHDGRYFTETELSQATGTTGSDLIGDDNSYSNFTPAAATVKGALSGIDAALGTASNAIDSVFRIKNNSDNTKQIAFDASAIATATTRTITMADADVDLADVNAAVLVDGSRPFTANQSMGNFRITNLAQAINPADAVNLAQLEAYVAGLDFQADVDAYVADASTTSPGNGLPAAATGQRYILASGTSSLDAGWGAISGVGDNDIVQYNGTSWVVAYDVSVEGEGALVWNRTDNYFMRWDGTSWSEFGGLAGITAGAGLLKSGNVLSIELDTNSGLEFDTPGDAGKLRVDADDSTIERSASGIRVKAAGITANELAASIAGSALSGGAGSPLDVNVDNSTIEVNSDALRVKAAGIQNTHVNTNVFDQSTITGGAGTPAAVQSAPQIKMSFVAGEAMAANTTWLVRMALFDLTETVGRVYKADKDASSDAKYVVIGWVRSASSINAGDTVTVNGVGTSAPGSFSNSQIGREIFLGSSGAQVLGASLANTTNEAQVSVGVVTGLGAFLFTGMQMRGIY